MDFNLRDLLCLNWALKFYGCSACTWVGGQLPHRDQRVRRPQPYRDLLFSMTEQRRAGAAQPAAGAAAGEAQPQQDGWGKFAGAAQK